MSIATDNTTDIVANQIDSVQPRKTLPSYTYSDRGTFEHEMRTLFRQNWLLAGRLSELAEPGTAKPVRVAGNPIILTRGSDGEVRAFHNVCSHRGMELLCQKQQGRKNLVCPYHAWTYNLEGKVVKAPHFTGGKQRTLPESKARGLGLRPVRLETWLDFIFVNFDDNAGSLHDYLSPLKERWANYDLSVLRHGASMTYEFDTNWKLIVENFLECYHVPFVHPALNTYSSFDDRYPLKINDHIMGLGSATYAPDDDPDALPSWPMSDNDMPQKAEYFAVFPIFLIGLMPDHLFAWTLEPVGPDKTIEHLNFYFVGEEGMSEQRAEKREATLARWKQVNDEDWSVIQRIQKGHESIGFRGPLFSPSLEKNIRDFQLVVSTYLPGNPAQM